MESLVTFVILFQNQQKYTQTFTRWHFFQIKKKKKISGIEMWVVLFSGLIYELKTTFMSVLSIII